MFIWCHSLLTFRNAGIRLKSFTSARLFATSCEMAIKGVLIDLSGTLHVDDDPTFDAVSALEKLRKLNVHIKFITNTTKESGETLHNRLTEIGFKLKRDEIFSSLSAAAEYVKEKHLNPFYLVSDDARKDFPSSNECYDSVVVGLAPDKFNYENLNKAFNILLDNKNLIAIHQGKYYKKKDGLALGPGCFVKGLEYSAGISPIVIGKPNKYFFERVIPTRLKFSECVMIGDDITDDIAGAMAVGMKGILVKTGKYRPELQIDPPPTVVLENFSEAVKWIEEQNAL